MCVGGGGGGGGREIPTADLQPMSLDISCHKELRNNNIYGYMV